MVLAPLLILGFWGLAYLRHCVLALTAPGVPVRFEYLSKAGLVRLYASSYVIDWDRGLIRVEKPKVYEPDGGVLAQIDHLSISGLKFLGEADRTVRIRGSNLYAQVRRQKNGRFLIQDLLPEQKGPPAQIPFSVQIDGIRVVLVDEVGPRRYQIPVSIPWLKVAGIGDNWVAVATPTIDGVGTLSGRLQNVANEGLQASAITAGLELAGPMRHFIETDAPKLKELSAQSVKVSGPVRVYLPQGKNAHIEARVAVSGHGVRYQDSSLDDGSFNGLVTSDGVIGKAAARSANTNVDFEGSFQWTKAPRGAGRLTAHVGNPQALPFQVRKLLPKDTSFSAVKFDGWVGFESLKAYRITGNVTADRVAYGKESLSGAVASVRADPKMAVIDLKKGSYQGSPVHGMVAMSPTGKNLSGAMITDSVDLAVLANRFKVPGVHGRADLVAALSGTFAKPHADFDVKGSGSYSREGKRYDIGSFALSGTYENGGVVLQRGVVAGPAGSIVANGRMDPRGVLDMRVVGRGLRPGVVNPSVKGVVNLDAKVTGKPADPLVTGRVEGYGLDLKGESISAIAADIRATKRDVRLASLQATRGSASFAGSGSYVFKTGAVGGDFDLRRVQAAEFLGEDAIGSLDLTSVKLGGTIKHPIADASISGNLLVQSINVTDLSGRARLDGDVATLSNAVAHAARGEVKGSASYNRKTGDGTAVADATDLRLRGIAPQTREAVTLDGTVSGHLSADIHKNLLVLAKGAGEFHEVVVNDSPVGDGSWSVSTDGKIIHGDAEIGQLDRYVSASGVTYNIDSQAIGGSIDLFNLHAENLVQGSLRYLSSLPFETQENLQTLTGLVKMGAELGGTVSKPNVDVKTFEIDNLTYLKQGLGTLTSKFARVDQKWTVHQLLLQGPVGRLSGEGSLVENDNVDFSGDLNHLDLRALGAFDGRLATTSGTADISFRVSGPAKSPDILASVQASGLLAPLAGAKEDQGLSLLFDRVQVSESHVGTDGKMVGGIDVHGGYTYSGFQGEMSLSAPFNYPGTIPPGPRNAKITLVERNLKEIATYAQGLDPARTDGTIGGEFSATGTSNDLTLGGEVKVNAPTIGWIGIDNSLKSVTGSMKLSGTRLALDLAGESSLGGSFKANASTGVDDLRTLVATLDKGRFHDILENPITGSVDLNDFSIRQGYKNRTYVAGAASGTINLGGSMSEPSIKGDLVLSNVDSVVPTLEPGTGTAPAYPINPRFDLSFNLANQARLRSSSADLSVLGSGSIRGSLMEPLVSATFGLEKGSIRLPSAVVRLEQGGTLQLDYGVQNGLPDARSNVDLEGHAALTAPGSGDNFERYDITLGVKGDLLKDGGLVLSAQSDPPGLSQDRILALLGQTDVLTTLTTGSRSEAETRIRNALAGYALPALLDPITSEIARNLGLDYLTIEYNAYDQATFSFARALNNEVFIQGRRQLGNPPPGFRARYDLRLVYRPRRVPGFLRRLSLSFGADQDRAWKIALEYGIRF